MQTLRFGVLGASRIAPRALIHPARARSDVRVMAVAARDPQRARAYAFEHGLAEACADYRALVEHPGLDAIYVGLPNALHAGWTRAALAAGRHVLVEKPAATSLSELRAMLDAADAAGRVCLEAMHSPHHPLIVQALALLRDGAIGAVQEVELVFTAPLRRPDDIRYDASLAGGALNDLGCYTVDLLLRIAGEAAIAVERVLHEPMPGGVDRAMDVALTLGGNARARMRFGFERVPWMQQRCVVRGSHGTLRLTNPFIPGWFGSMRLDDASGTRRWRADRRSSYAYQLDAFVAALADPVALRRAGAEARARQALIDAIRAQAAG